MFTIVLTLMIGFILGFGTAGLLQGSKREDELFLHREVSDPFRLDFMGPHKKGGDRYQGATAPAAKTRDN